MTIEESFAQRMDIQKTYENIQSLFSAIPSIFRQSEILENFPKAMLDDYTRFITALNVLGLILTILSLWLSLQLDPQAEKIIQQNEKAIEQGEIQIQQNERIIELLEKNSKDQDIVL